VKIKILATGGTFDKIYYDAKSDFHIGDPKAVDILVEANVTFEYDVESILKKDSLDITAKDREHIRQNVVKQSCNKIVITHGTDTMVETAMQLQDIPDKTIVITGAMQPARMRYSDSPYNLGVAVTAAQLLPPGVYLAMNGQIFDPSNTKKNVEQNRFESAD